jgi:integrase
VRNHALAAWAAENKRRRKLDPEATTLAPMGLHESRHTCASVLIASGANPKIVQRIMGHATIAMTFDTHGHLMPDGLDHAAAAANTYLAAAVR